MLEVLCPEQPKASTLATIRNGEFKKGSSYETAFYLFYFRTTYEPFFFTYFTICEKAWLIS